MTSLRRDNIFPSIEESEDSIHVTLHLQGVPTPADFWLTAFNEVTGDSGCEAGFLSDKVALNLTLPLGMDQSATDAKLEHVERLISKADEHFEESNSAWITMRSQVQDWWMRRLQKDCEGS